MTDDARYGERTEPAHEGNAGDSDRPAAPSIDAMDSDLAGEDVGDQGTIAEGIANFIDENPHVGEQIEQFEVGAAWAPEAGDPSDSSMRHADDEPQELGEADSERA